MLQGWDILLKNILKSIGEPSVKIVHWSLEPERFTQEQEQQLSKLNTELDGDIEHIIIYNKFPINREEQCSPLPTHM